MGGKQSAEKIAERNRIWNAENKDWRRSYNRAWYQRNKEYQRVRAREWHQQNKETKNHNRRLKKEELASRPRPLICECCGNPDPNRALCWDHDHNTGVFRGWLCHRCNRVIGQSEDSQDVLRMMISYLDKYGKPG